jgi:hypothetical protein
MKLVISIEIDDLSEIQDIDKLLSALAGLQQQVSPAKVPIRVDLDGISPGLTDTDDGVDETPDPPKPKRKRATKKRARKVKAARKVVEQKIPKELPDVDPDEELSLVPKGQETSVMADTLPNVPAKKKEKSADERMIENDEKVVKLRDEPEPPDEINPNIIFSLLVQKSQQAAIQLLKDHGLTRFSQAEGETLVAMIEDAQLLLAEAG